MRSTITITFILLACINTLICQTNYKTIIPFDYSIIDILDKVSVFYNLDDTKYLLVSATKNNYLVGNRTTKKWTLKNWDNHELFTLDALHALLKDNYIIYTKIFSNQTDYSNYLRFGNKDRSIQPGSPVVFKTGIFDTDGNEILELAFDEYKVSNGKNSFTLLKKEHDWYLFNGKTNNLKKIDIKNINRVYAFTKDFIAIDNHEKFFMLDTNLNVIYSDILIENSNIFIDTIIPQENIVQNKKYFVEGNFVIKSYYEMDNGRKVRKNKILSSAGNLINNDSYRNVKKCNDDCCIVNKIIYSKKHKTFLNTIEGVVNQKGEYVIPVEYSRIYMIGEGYFKLKKSKYISDEVLNDSNSYKILDPAFNTVYLSNPEHNIYRFKKYWRDTGTYRMKINKLFDADFNLMFNEDFSNFEHLFGNLFIASKNNKYGLIQILN